MIFVIGGAFQGKSEFVMDHFKISEKDMIEGGSCELNMIYCTKAINHFERLVQRFMKADKELDEIIDRLMKENKNVIIISTEIGCGLVPIDKSDREYREKVGRVCCQIAKHSNKVYRVQCGIGTKIQDKHNSEPSIMHS